MYLIYYIFLPLKLLHKDNFDLEFETILLNTTIDILLKFKGFITYDQSVLINLVIAMIANLRTIRDSFGTAGVISKRKLENALRDLCKKGKHLFYNSYALFIFFNSLKGGMIPLHIRA
jgi:hypothetical protein